MKLSILLPKILTPSTVKTVLFVWLLCPLAGWAQTIKITPEDTQRKQSYLIMRDGSMVRGHIIRQDSSIITVRRRGGDMSFIEADQLLKISPVRPGVAGEVSGGQTRSAVRHTIFVLKDSSRVEGQFVRRDSTMITVRKRNGQLTYFEPELLVRVDSVQVESSDGRGPVIMANRFSPWLLTGHTAYNPEKGRFYYRNTWLLLNEFDYGITRFWSVGANFIAPVPYLVYADPYYGWGQYWQTASKLFTKISAPIGESFRLGLNTTYQANQRYNYVGVRGTWTFQAVASMGSSQRNVTFGYGIAVPRAQYQSYLYQPPTSSMPQYVRIYIPNQSFLSVGLVQKVSPGLTIVSDNRVNLGEQYSYYNQERVTASFALRLDRQRHAFDLGLTGLIYSKPELWDNKSVRIFPYLGYNLLIGQD